MSQQVSLIQQNCKRLLFLKNNPIELSQTLQDLCTLLQQTNSQQWMFFSSYLLLPLLPICYTCVLQFLGLENQNQIRIQTNGLVFEKCMQCLFLIVSECDVWVDDKAMEVIAIIGPSLHVRRGEVSEETRINAMSIILKLLDYCEEQSFTCDDRRVPMFAQIIQSCINISEAESEAGSGGSKQLRSFSFSIIKKIIEIIQDPDVVAFFLPGVASACSKALLAAHRRKNGVPATASGPIINSLQCMERLVTSTLADSSFEVNTEAASNISAQNIILKLQNVQENNNNNNNKNESVNKIENLEKIRINRDSTWLEQTAQKIDNLIRKVLPPICVHQNPQVRLALANFCMEILILNQNSMKISKDLLIEIILTLAQDDFEIVRKPCKDFLEKIVNSNKNQNQKFESGMEIIVVKLIKQLQESFQFGELQIQLQCQQLAAALKLVDLKTVIDDKLVRQLLESLGSCVEFEQSAAGIMLQGCVMQDNTREQKDTAPKFPQIPLGLKLCMQPKTYQGIASVMHALAQDVQNFPRYVSFILEFLQQITNQKSPGWQLVSSSYIVLLNEFLYSFYKQKSDLLEKNIQNNQQSTNFIQITEDILNSLFEENFWSELDTFFHEDENSEQDSDSIKNLCSFQDTQSFGRNALLVVQILQTVGCCVQGLGTDFRKIGRLTRKVLVPVLERACEPTKSTASMAEGVIKAMVQSGEYNSFSDLLTHNSDYLIDGICKQLKRLDQFPRAPFLLAAILRQTDVAAALLPLLQEPAVATFKGLSITERTKKNSVWPYLLILQEIVQAAKMEAEQVLEQSKLAAEFLTEKQQEIEDSMLFQISDYSFHKSDEPTDMDEIEEYFRQRWTENNKNKENIGDIDDDSRLPYLNNEQFNQLMDRRNRLVAVGELCDAAADSLAPILCSKNMKWSIRSMDCLVISLYALKFVTDSDKLDEERVMPHVDKTKKFTIIPNKLPKILPQIHKSWPLLLQALKDHRIAVMENAFKTLVKVCAIGGDWFMRRRFEDDVWPLMFNIIQHGTIEIPKYPMQPIAQAVIDRSRYAVFSCIADLCKKQETAQIFQGIISKAIKIIIQIKSEQKISEKINQSIVGVFKGFAAVDKQQIWNSFINLISKDEKKLYLENNREKLQDLGVKLVDVEHGKIENILTTKSDDVVKKFLPIVESFFKN